MTVYRISRGKFYKDLSGKGAELYGGRWNNKGTALLYTAESKALACLEVAVHVSPSIMPKDYQLITITFPDTAPVRELKQAELPVDWKNKPHSDSTQKIGDQFVVEGRFLALKVPSVVVPGDFNYLLNPAHPQYAAVRIVATEPFEFDDRLFLK